MESGAQEQLEKSRVVKVESEESWKYFISQPTPVVVHFTAAWCMPSVAMNSSFEDLAFNYQDILFLLVDVDDMKEVAKKMEVTAMPTFLVMKGGVQVDKLVGANPEEIRKMIESFLHSTHSIT